MGIERHEYKFILNLFNVARRELVFTATSVLLAGFTM